MRGMRVRHAVITGASQSASLLTTFVNDGYNRGQIDVYVITRGGGPFDDFSTPIFQVNEEDNLPDQADNRHYVVWEEAGTAHAPAVGGTTTSGPSSSATSSRTTRRTRSTRRAP